MKLFVGVDSISYKSFPVVDPTLPKVAPLYPGHFAYGWALPFSILRIGDAMHFHLMRNVTTGFVSGNLYEVNEAYLAKLDKTLAEHGYERIPVEVFAPGLQERSRTKAFTYSLPDQG